ncbi:MAG: M28 family peptidase [Chloroflexota bacterium]|nr:M28 family peptidase [Chloroflexota bacterium]
MTVATENPITGWTDEPLERAILDEVSLDTARPVLERLSSLVRLSGSDQEREAFDLLIRHLTDWGVPHTLHEPRLFISIPLAASVRDPASGTSFRAKTSAMSRPTNGEIEAGLVYLPAATDADLDDVVSGAVQLSDLDVTGKIVITEGMPFPGIVTAVTEAGARAGIFIAPGVDIHETICTTVWGTPDLDSEQRIPTLPVVAVNNPDGRRLIELARRGGAVAISSEVDTGWRPIPILVAEIPGAVVPDEFVLLHGHADSWHVGVGDNATGNVTKLELARVLWQNREQLTRSVRIAWWSGHSHGRYAGSTWYADQFGIDLALNCVAQINCDSPGCRRADTFNDLTCMSEAEPFVDTTIRDITGITPATERPVRAGDYSFNQIGITSYLMLSSTMSETKREELGYYRVGGCGGNIAWHTEHDTLDIADRDNLLRDMRLYAAIVLRTANAPLHPFDWRRTTADMARTINDYQEAAAEAFDFAATRTALASLDLALADFYQNASDKTDPAAPAARTFNKIQRRLARLLVPVNYSRMAHFWHDPALHVPALPDLAPALTAATLANEPDRAGILRAHLTRGQNRLVWTLIEARDLVTRTLA